MATKMTKKDWFAEVTKIVEKSDVENKADVLAFINHEVKLLEKKSERSAVSKTQKANLVTMNTIKDVLRTLDKPVTISELMEFDALKVYTEETKDGEREVKMTNQKLSSLVKKLVDAKEVVRTEEKKKAYFAIAQRVRAKALPLTIRKKVDNAI